MYAKTIVPIGGLYAGTLWLGNAAYVHLSVSFIQMLKVGRRAHAGARGQRRPGSRGLATLETFG